MSAVPGKVACVVPAFDAGTTLQGVLRGISAAAPATTIIVVDDGSTDDTRRIAERHAHSVLVHDSNRGKGVALRSGFHEALATGADVIVTIDADGQHDPSRMPALVSALEYADIAIGTRERDAAMPLRRRITNSLASASVGAIMGTRIPDAQSGFRAIRREVLEKVAASGDGYEYETDLLIRAGRAGFRIAPVHIPTIYGAPSHFHPWRDSLAVVRTIWRHRAGALR